MYKPKVEKDIRCPLEYGLDIFGGKWKSRIICVLDSKKILRYSELRTELENITDAVLSSALKELILDQIVCRQAYDAIPRMWNIPLRKEGSRLCQFCRVFANGQLPLPKPSTRI